jgi:hypothetical protein
MNLSYVIAVNTTNKMGISSMKTIDVGVYIRRLLQKSWQHNFSEISKAPTGISKFAAERQQRLISNDAAR